MQQSNPSRNQDAPNRDLGRKKDLSIRQREGVCRVVRADLAADTARMRIYRTMAWEEHAVAPVQAPILCNVRYVDLLNYTYGCGMLYSILQLTLVHRCTPAGHVKYGAPRDQVHGNR